MTTVEAISRRNYLVDPASLIVMENHDDAFRSWQKAGLSNATLLHFDAHIDFKWITPSAESLLEESSIEAMQMQIRHQSLWSMTGKSAEDRTHIGNYIHRAITEGIVGKFIWIYPDGANREAQIQAVKNILSGLAAMAPRSFQITEPDHSGCFRGNIEKASFWAAPFSRLEHVLPDRNVLLNIDVDFFVIRALYGPYYPFSNLVAPSFWLEPERFVHKLMAAGISPALTTLAFSVEEGYTPLALKFIGTELAARLTRGFKKDEAEKYVLLRRIYDERNRAPLDDLILSAEEQVQKLGDAETWFNLSRLYSQKRDWECARAAYQAALRRDPSYGTLYNHPGPILWDRGFYEEAESSYETMRHLDPDQPDHALFAMKKFFREKKWEKGAEYARQILARGVDSFHLRVYFGECLYHLKRYQEASEILKIDEDTLSEDLKFPNYLWLRIRIAQKQKKWEETLLYYHFLNQYMIQSPEIHWSLAVLYAKTGNFYKMKRHALKSLRLWTLKILVTIQGSRVFRKPLNSRELLS